MALDGKQRRTLAGQGNRLKATITIQGQSLSDSVVEHLRAALFKHELRKVRLGSDDRDECDLIAAEIAARVPCELVQRVGRVALLYREQVPAAE